MTRWRKSVPPGPVLQSLAASRTINENGSISFTSFEADEYWLELLQTALVDESVSGSIHADAIKAASRRVQAPTPDQFMKLYLEERNRIKSVTSSYLVAFPVWGKSSFLDGGAPSLSSSVSFWPELQSSVLDAIHSERARMKKKISLNTFKPYFLTMTVIRYTSLNCTRTHLWTRSSVRIAN